MSEKVSVPEIFGMNVFNDAMMREHLPKKVYEELKNTIERGGNAQFRDCGYYCQCNEGLGD